MKASELRIGNFIERKIEGIGNISWTKKRADYSEIEWASRHIEKFNLEHKPIPLTEDWLIKFGFEYKNFNETKSVYWHIGDFGINVFDQKGFRCNQKGLLIGSKIQYVHQLQNLYYALTDKELVYE